MSFISYNLDYYTEALERLEHNPASKENVYYAKQLLKFIMDIEDEGYHDLPDALRKQINGVYRLEEYIKNNHDNPFPVKLRSSLDFVPSYGEEIELEKCIDSILEDSIEYKDSLENKEKKEFLKELIDYTNWIGYEEDTTYIFLLRDTLMQYLLYKNQKKENIVSWLLGRKMINSITNENDADDIYIRNAINEALDNKINNYQEFKEFVSKRIRENLDRIPEFKQIIQELLANIQTKKIMVVESGYYGTFPMLLMALDERVDFRMFCTIPQLFDIYQDKIYSKAYEKNRWFETLYAQDLLITYSNFKDGQFYVKKCMDEKIMNEANKEIREMIK